MILRLCVACKAANGGINYLCDTCLRRNTVSMLSVAGSLINSVLLEYTIAMKFRLDDNRVAVGRVKLKSILKPPLYNELINYSVYYRLFFKDMQGSIKV